MPRPNRTLARRLVVVIVGVTAAALVLSGVVAVLLIRRSVVETTVHDVERQAEQLAAAIGELGVVLDRRSDTGIRQQPRRGAGGDDEGGGAGTSPDTAAPGQGGAAAADTTSGGEVGTQPSAQAEPGEDERVPEREPPPGLTVIAKAVFAALFGGEASDLYEITRAGTLGAPLVRGPGGPPDQSVVDTSEIDTTMLLAGDVQSGTTRFEGDRWAWAAAGTQVAETDLAVVIAAPINSPIAPRTGSLFIAGLAALVIAAAVSVWLARWLTRPVLSLTHAAAAVSSGDYSSRVDESREDELGELARTFNSMADDLSRAREAERSFLMLVSHDLRTPLTAIKGYAEAIADGAVKEDRAAHAAEIIGAETARLERLVEDLLDLARFEAKEFRLHPEPVEVDRLLADLVDSYGPRAEAAQLELSARGNQLPVTVTDPHRLAQIVRNLLENGLRYVPSGSSLSVGWWLADSGTICVQVSDTGSGIAADDLPHVFERLYMAKRYRGERQVGSGLGLAIVADLTRALGGLVSVTSEVGVGTAFLVRLPVVAPGREQAASTSGRLPT